MNKIALPSPALLRQLLRYDTETGWLYWKPRSADMFVNPVYQGRWNSRYAGRRAFASMLPNGYYTGRIFDVQLFAHRVIWAMVNDAIPAEVVDHINGDKADNRASNLRAVTHQQNHQNMKRSKANTSGCTGVGWHAAAGKWCAKIKLGHDAKHLGLFDSIAEAVVARKAAERLHGFHPNHGRAA